LKQADDKTGVKDLPAAADDVRGGEAQCDVIGGDCSSNASHLTDSQEHSNYITPDKHRPLEH